MVAEQGYPMVGVCCTADDLPTTNYRLKLEAKKIDGTDFFCLLTFPVGDSHASLVVGGWGGNVTGISCVNDEDASQNDTRTAHKYETGSWYAIEVTVTDERICCRIDGEEVVNQPREGNSFSIRNDVWNTVPLGICSFETRAAWRNIRLEQIQAEK